MQEALINALRDPAKLGRFVQQEINEEEKEKKEIEDQMRIMSLRL
jgi:hypothetical protein